MSKSTSERISITPLATGLIKFGVSPFLFLFSLLWGGGIIAASWTHPGNPPIWVGVPIGLIAFGAICHCVFALCLPLKVVWLEDQGIRLANFESELVVPYEAIARIEEKRGWYRLIVIRLDRDSYYGRRFTFLSTAPLGPWPAISLPADEGVAELRRRVDAARAGRKRLSPPRGRASRSIMADEELDGPL